MTTPVDLRSTQVLWRLALGLSVAYALALVLPIPLFDPDEGLHAAIAREMVEHGDWVTPHLLGVPFLDKPILYFWALATSLSVFGPSEFAVRLPGIAFGIAGVLATASLGAALGGRRAGALSGLIHATMLVPFAVSAVSVHDIALVPFTTLTMLALWRAARAGNTGAAIAWGAAAGVVLGLAVLTKALSGVAAVGLPFAIWMVWDRRVRVSLLAAGVVCVAVAALVALPWYLAMEHANAGYLHYYFVERHLLGYTTSTQLHGQRAWWYYLPIVAAGALPWTGFLWMALRDVRQGGSRDEASVHRLLWTWLVVGLVFFSSAGSKLLTYVLPLFPVVALLVGTMWNRRWQANDIDDRGMRLADSLGGGLLSLLLPLLVGVAMQRFNLTPEPLFGTFVVVAGLGVAGFWLRGTRTGARDRFVRLVAAFGVVAALAVLVVMAPAGPAFSARAVARYYNAQGAVPPTIWFVNERVGSFLFYLDRDLRESFSLDTAENVTLERLLSMRQAPPGLVIAVPFEQVALIERRISLAGVPHMIAGQHRIYEGAVFADAIRRGAR